MDDRIFFVDGRFMRLFLLTAAWAVLGPGLFFLFVISAKLIGGFLSLIGIVMVVLAVYGKGLKIGYYSKNRIILLAFSGLAVLVSAVTMKVFFLFSYQTYWLVYFVLTIGFLILSAVALVRSVQMGRDLDTNQTDIGQSPPRN